MNDLISVKTLTEAMTEWAKENFSLDDEYGHILQGMEKVLDLIVEQPTVDRWIPCSERRPGYDADGTAPLLRQTLVTTRNRKGGLHVKTSYFSVFTGRWLCEAENEDIEVIAWMPLPSPYKAGDIDG